MELFLLAIVLTAPVAFLRYIYEDEDYDEEDEIEIKDSSVINAFKKQLKK